MTLKLDFQKIDEIFAYGYPLENGYTNIKKHKVVFFAGLTGSGASSTAQLLCNEHQQFKLLPSRSYFMDKIVIPWVQSNKKLPVVPVTNRKIRYEYGKFFRKYYPEGIVQILDQLSTNKNVDNSEYLIFDSVKHVRELMKINKYFPSAYYVLFRTHNLDRVIRLTNQDYSRRDIGDSVNYSDIYKTPGWRGVLSEIDMKKLEELVNNGEIQLEAINKALQIVIKEHQDYDNDLLAMKLFNIAHDRTLLVDSSAFDPHQRAELIFNWIKLVDKPNGQD